jgi:2-aminoadipate transaminase
MESRLQNVEVNSGRQSGAELLAASALAEPMRSDIQYGHTDGVIDLTWGHPDPSTFPSEAVAIATEAMLIEHGWQALTYGAPAGAAFVRDGIADHLARVDAIVSPDDVVITSGSSGALDLVLSLLASPGDVVFVEQPTYFLALRIFADHGVEVIGLRSDGSGPDPDYFDAATTAPLRYGQRTFLYLVPTYANPTGRCLSADRARALLNVAAATGTLVIEDDVYRDTSPSAPPSMSSFNPEIVIRLGSFSKSLAPGLRVGYLTASPAITSQIANCGLLDSGGSVNHFAAMVVGELIRSGRFVDVVSEGQARYRSRREAMLAAIDSTLMPAIAPDGGYFLWLPLPAGVSSTNVTAAGRNAGVLVSNGRLFYADEPDSPDHSPDHSHVRASFSMLDESLLIEGARRLNRVVTDLVDR